MRPTEQAAAGETIETRSGTPGFNAARTTGASFLIFVGVLAGVVFAILLGVAMLFGDGVSAHPLWLLGFIASVMAVGGGFSAVVKPRVAVTPIETSSPTADLFAELGIPAERAEAPISMQSVPQEQVVVAAAAGAVGAVAMAIVAAGLIGLGVLYLAGYIFGLW